MSHMHKEGGRDREMKSVRVYTCVKRLRMCHREAPSQDQAEKKE